MKEQYGSQRTIEDAGEIVEILRVARMHGWKFSYAIDGMVPGVAFITEILAVNPEYGSVTIGSEVKYLGLKEYEGISFKVQNGGISVRFNSTLLPNSEESTGRHWYGQCRIAIPKQLEYGQQRQAVRVNFANLEVVPVTLFTGDGRQVSGIVDDISVSGLRAKFQGGIPEKFDTSGIVTDCRMKLPNASSVSVRVQVLGGMHDPRSDASLMRFRFLELHNDVELKLQDLINKALEQLERQEKTRTA
jgi:c-di-GMP-binding flagellar brake protein YcgR